MPESASVNEQNDALIRAYRQCFGSPAGRQVLGDLARFCRAVQTTFHTDGRIHAALEGRREVFLRIQEFTQLLPEQIMKLRIGQDYRAEEDDDD